LGHPPGVPRAARDARGGARAGGQAVHRHQAFGQSPVPQ
jgi:hypothetical protein